MSNPALDYLSLDEMEFILSRLPELYPGYFTTLTPEDRQLKVQDDDLDLAALRQTIGGLCTLDDGFNARVHNWLREYEQTPPKENALADIGIGAGFIAITLILSLVAAQMHADSLRQHAPDEERNADGSLKSHRKYFDIALVLQRLEKIVGVLPKSILDKVESIVEAWNKKG